MPINRYIRERGRERERVIERERIEREGERGRGSSGGCVRGYIARQLGSIVRF